MDELTVDMRMNWNSIARSFRARTVLTLSLGHLFCVSVAAQVVGTSESSDIRRDATVLAVERVMPSVVNIATKSIQPVRSAFDEWFPGFPHQQVYGEYYSLGSGVVIDEAGYLLDRKSTRLNSS